MKANDKLPTKAAPKTAICDSIFDSGFNELIFCNNKTIDQNMNKMVKALAEALIILSTNPICAGSDAKIEKNAPNI